MTAANTPADAASPAPAPADAAARSAARARARSVPRSGWAVVANKEFADHLLSVRFVVLLIILGLAVGIPFFLASEQLRSLASQASGAPALFLALFQLGINVPIFQIDVTIQSFIALAAPLLGLAFAFDAVNGERHQGTLPRLLSQPIHRDDVINGKFAAGLAVITVVLVAMVMIIGGFGLLRLGITPSEQETLRVIVWLLVTILYVSFWLAFGLLLSVVIRRAATSALVGLGVWLFVAVPFFGPFLVGLAAAVFSPDDADTQHLITQLVPSTLYQDISGVILNPIVATTSRAPTTSQILQAQSFFPDSSLSVTQSLLLVWPEIVILFALTIGCFALAYVRFMRQEVRA